MFLLSDQLLLLLLLIVYDQYSVIILLLLLAIYKLAVRIGSLHLNLSLVILLLLLLFFGSDVDNLLFDVAFFFFFVVFAHVFHLVAVVDWHAIHAFFVGLFVIILVESRIIISDATTSTVDIAVVVVFSIHAVRNASNNFLIVVIFRQCVAATITTGSALCLTTRCALQDDLLDFLVH